MGAQPTMDDIAKIKAAWDRDIAAWSAKVEALRKAGEAVLDAERRMDVQAMDRAMTKIASALASSIADPISSDADFAPKSLDCNAKGLISSAEESAVYPEWRPMSELPDPERRIILLYADGSGSGVYFHAEGGLIYDGEDGCSYSWESRTQYSHWAYLPRGYRLWVEDNSDDPLTLPADPPLPSPAEARSEQPAPQTYQEAVDAYNAVFDPAFEAGQEVFNAGFRDGWIYANTCEGGDDYDEAAERFSRSVDGVEMGEAWDAHRDAFFKRLPLAALPPLPTPPKAEADHG